MMTTADKASEYASGNTAIPADASAMMMMTASDQASEQAFDSFCDASAMMTTASDQASEYASEAAEASFPADASAMMMTASDQASDQAFDFFFDASAMMTTADKASEYASGVGWVPSGPTTDASA